MEPRSSDTNIIEWLNTLIVMAQWDKSLPLYFGRLIRKTDQYQKALVLIRETPPNGPLPASAGDALSDDEWQKLYKLTSCALPLRQMFADSRDPFQGGSPDEISLLGELSDLTTDPQTMFYSRNGTFHLVLEAVRQRSELNTAELISDSLNSFYMLLQANEQVAKLLYELAGSNDSHVVLASLYDGRDYTADESEATKETLKTWNQKLSTELRAILLRPTKLFRAPKSLVKLAWERRDLFKKASDLIPQNPTVIGSERIRKISNEAYRQFVAEAKDQLEAVEAELQLLAVVARHYISVRKFAKLDGLVYAWPRIAALAMANYPNLEYVEGFFVERKPRPTETELEARDARELYDLCVNNAGLIRFLRLRPYFKEIDENELRRYRPLAAVTISDPAQPVPAATITIQSPPVIPTPVVSAPMRSRVCELIIEHASLDTPAPEEFEFEVSLNVSSKEPVKGQGKLSVRKLLDTMLRAVGVPSEESLQSVLKNISSGTAAEQILIRGGTQLFNAIIGETGLEDPFWEAFQGGQPVRLIISSNIGDLFFLPWEWLPRPGYAELLLSHSRFSLVRSRPFRTDVSPPSLFPPIKLLGLFPNGPVGSRNISEDSVRALESVVRERGVHESLIRRDADWLHVQATLSRFLPDIAHFEGYITFEPETLHLSILFSSNDTITEVPLAQFGPQLVENGVKLFVVGRNEVTRVLGNPGAIFSNFLISSGVLAVLAPIRAVDDVTATTFTTEFYTAFLTGNSLEQALYIARRKVASRGGDWTAFALFANPSVLDFFQPLPQLS
jgi:CHAT domain